MALRRNHIDIGKCFELTNVENLGVLCLLRLLTSPLVKVDHPGKSLLHLWEKAKCKQFAHQVGNEARD